MAVRLLIMVTVRIYLHCIQCKINEFYDCTNVLYRCKYLSYNVCKYWSYFRAHFLFFQHRWQSFPIESKWNFAHICTAARQSKQLIFIHSVISNALLILRMQMQIADVTDIWLARANQIDSNQYAICMLHAPHKAIWYRYLHRKLPKYHHHRNIASKCTASMKLNSENWYTCESQRYDDWTLCKPL